MLKWLVRKCKKCHSRLRKVSSRYSRWVLSYRERRVRLPHYREAADLPQGWEQALARLPAYKDLLAWVAHRRDRRFDEIIKTKREGNLIELRGEIKALEEVYRILSSYLEE